MKRLILMLGLWSSIHASLAQDESESLEGVWKGDLSPDVLCAIGCTFRQSAVSPLAFELEISADGRASIQQPSIAKDLIVIDLGLNAIVLGRRRLSTDSRQAALAISLNLSRIDENTLFVYFYMIETSDSSDVRVPSVMQGSHGVLTLERSD